jgi:hypothetical protein
MVLLCDVGQVETHFTTFGDRILMQGRCTIWAKHTIGSENHFFSHLIVLLGDVEQTEAHFDMFGDNFNLGARKVHGLCLMYHGHGNRFGHTQWYSYVMYVKWKLVLVRLKIVLVLVLDRCMV